MLISIRGVSSAAPRARDAWPFAAFLLLCMVELGLLTTRVEVQHGLLAQLASPRVASLLLLTAAMVLVHCGGDLVRSSIGEWRASRLLWLGVNVALFVWLFWWTVDLAERNATEELTIAQAAGWLQLSLAVALSAALAFFSCDYLVRAAKTHGPKFVGSFALSAGLVLYTSDIQQLWAHAQSPTLELSRRAIELIEPKGAFVHFGYQGDPVLGIRGGAALRVTPFCAEMESFAAFWLLGGTLLVARWNQARPGRFLVVMLSGTLILFFINGLRLAALVEIAEHVDQVGARTAVSLAHSRWSGMLFLALSLLILLGSSRWWRASWEQNPGH